MNIPDVGDCASCLMESCHPLVNRSWLRFIVRRATKNLDRWGAQDYETLGLAIAAALQERPHE